MHKRTPTYAPPIHTPQVTAVCCGAILSTYQRLRVESVCYRLGLASLSYLWQRDQTELLHEMVTWCFTLLDPGEPNQTKPNHNQTTTKTNTKPAYGNLTLPLIATVRLTPPTLVRVTGRKRGRGHSGESCLHWPRPSPTPREVAGGPRALPPFAEPEVRSARVRRGRRVRDVGPGLSHISATASVGRDGCGLARWGRGHHGHQVVAHRTKTRGHDTSNGTTSNTPTPSSSPSTAGASPGSTARSSISSSISSSGWPHSSSSSQPQLGYPPSRAHHQ